MRTLLRILLVLTAAALVVPCIILAYKVVFSPPVADAQWQAATPLAFVGVMLGWWAWEAET